MTQNTQTTAERLFALILENIGYTDGDDRTVATIAAEIDRLTAERDAARAEVATLTLDAESWRQMKNTFADAKQLADELAAARAEVERLRLPAEAYNAQVKWEMSEGGTTQEIAKAWTEYLAAANRARAAKESQP